MTGERRQLGAPLLLDSAGRVKRLFPVPFGSPSFREERLQQLLAQYPDLIPLLDIEPAFAPVVFLGREVPVGSGSVDLLYASPRGYLVLVETKLWDNPEARREVVAQIIDYATEMSEWTFEELSTAVSKSQGAGGHQGGQDVLSIMREFEGDFDEQEFIDAVTRNLARGYFLLLIVGNGIREGVVRMAAHLQQSPGLHFSLALVEMCLYQMDEKEDLPLILQPRTIATTVELVRAVVEIRAPQGIDVEVTLRDEQEEKKRPARRKLTEDIFCNELAQNTSEETAAQVRMLIEDLQSLGLATRWRATSVSMRLPDPGQTSHQFTVVVLTTGGTFYLGWLDRVAEAGGYDDSIALRYRNSVAELVGVPQGKYYETDLVPLPGLLARRDDFLACVRTFVEELRGSAKDEMDDYGRM